MMGKTLVLILIVCLCVILHQKVDACSCQPEHPQHLFCKSEFVIKALVGRARLVELGDDGKFRRIHTEKPEEEDDENESSGYGDKDNHEEEENSDVHKVNIMNENAGEASEPVVVVERVLPFPFTDERNRDPQPSNLNAAARYKRLRKRKAKAARRSKRSGLKHISLSYRPTYRVIVAGGPPGAPSVQATPQRRLMMQYKISIVKTFKGLVNVSKEQRAYMYTPPYPLCSMKLTTNKSPFILMGNMLHGVMVIRECDYKIDLSKLSKVESKNLIRNMRFRFEDGCKNCHIRVCNRGGCGPATDRQPFQCKWLEWWTVQTPGASQFACIPGKSGKCHWYNSGNKSAKQGDLTLTYSR